MRKKVIISLIISILVLILFLGGLYFYGLTAVSKKDDLVTFEVSSGASIKTVINDLYNAKIIKSKISSLIYIKLNPNISFQAGTYNLNRKDNTKEIFTILDNGDAVIDSVSITFVEGKRLVDYISQIEKTFGYKEEEILALLSDKEYLQELINTYYFIDESILNEDIYYSLEGYLFPSTYEFYKDESLKGIFKKMLDKMQNVLDNYSTSQLLSEYSYHEILTMASIVELEGAHSLDREGVAGVFYNRLKSGDSLGSDVTTYYAVRKDFSEPLYNSELNNCNNGYNTRNGCNRGKLPVGPISNPSASSIEAALNPESHDYYYFVADKNKNTYFTKTYSEHQAKIAELKNKGLWYEYE